MNLPVCFFFVRMISHGAEDELAVKLEINLLSCVNYFYRNKSSPILFLRCNKNSDSLVCIYSQLIKIQLDSILSIRFAEQAETDWSPITTPDGWIIIQSPSTEKLPQTQESTTEPVAESTVQSLTSGKIYNILIVAFASALRRVCSRLKKFQELG